MKYKLRKGLAVGLFCLFILMVVPATSGDFIEYSEENGPYVVYARGPGSGRAGGFPAWMAFGPFVFLIPPFDVGYVFKKGTIFKINTVVQDIDYPVKIYFEGLKGYAPGDPLCILKFFIGGKITVFGICPEIKIYPID